MSLQDLGKMVKQKYPSAYQNTDDATLGQQVLAKYPQYKNIADQGATQQPQQAQPQQSKPIEQSGILGSILSTLGNAIGATKAGGAGTPQEDQSLKQSSKTAYKRELGGASEIAAYVAPVGKALKGLSFAEKAAQIASKGLIRGTGSAVGKGLQAGKSAIDTIKNIPLDSAAFAALDFGSLGLEAVAKGEAGLSHWLTTQSELADVPRGLKVAKSGQMGGTTVMGKVIDYGANTLAKAKAMSEQLTGGGGVIDKVVREVSDKVNPDVSGLLDIAKQRLGLENVVKDINKYGLSSAERRFYQDTLNATTTRGGTLGDTKAGIDVFQSIKDFEKEAARLGKNPATQDVATSYREVANEMKNRLYQGLDSAGKKATTGADEVLTSGIKEKYLSEIQKISPSFAKDFLKTKTVGEMRSLLAPFVRASQMFDSVSGLAEAGAKGLNIGSLAGGKKGLISIVDQLAGTVATKGTAAVAGAAGKITEKAASSNVLKVIGRLLAGKINQ